MEIRARNMLAWKYLPRNQDTQVLAPLMSICCITLSKLSSSYLCFLLLMLGHCYCCGSRESLVGCMALPSEKVGRNSTREEVPNRHHTRTGARCWGGFVGSCRCVYCVCLMMTQWQKDSVLSWSCETAKNWAVKLPAQVWFWMLHGQGWSENVFPQCCSHTLQWITPLKGFTLANAIPQSWHCAPSGKPWPKDKGSWECGGWDLNGWQWRGCSCLVWVCGRTVNWCQIESCFWSLIMIFCDVRYLVVFFF